MMTILDEVRRRYDRPDLTPHTAGAEDPDQTSLDDLRGMVDKVLDVGYERRKELDELAKHNRLLQHYRDGSYYIEHAHAGQYADFYEQANREYLKATFPWLHDVSGGVGLDEDKGADSHGTFEAYLASISHEDWEQFKEVLDQLEDYLVLDEDGANELEMKEVTRWVTEDGGPELIRYLRDSASDAYEGYLLNKITIDMVFEWMSASSSYPESQGQGDVWMDMERHGKDEDVRAFFLDELEDDVAGWMAVKREQFGIIGKAFESLLQKMAREDESVAHVYHRLDEEALWQLFLQTFPDERREEDDPYWYYHEPYLGQESWRVGYKPDTHNPDDWKTGVMEAMENLEQSEWFWKLVRNWYSRGPEGHPEFKFENQEDMDSPEALGHYIQQAGWSRYQLAFDSDAGLSGYTTMVDVPTPLLAGLDIEGREEQVIQYAKSHRPDIDQFDWQYLVDINAVDEAEISEAQEVDPDDPEIFIRHGGGLQEDIVYEDDKIRVLYPRDYQSLNYHLRPAGIEINRQNWVDLFKYNDVFILQGKQSPDAMGRTGYRELGVIWGAGDIGLKVFTGTHKTVSLESVLALPEYGKSIRRMLLRFYRERVQDDAKNARLLLQLGGARELRRAERLGHISQSDLGVDLGLYYIGKHRYDLAAKAFDRPRSTILPKGVWLLFDDVEDLAAVFKNSDAARTVFSNDHYDWFDHYYDGYRNDIKVESVLPYLSAKAIKHIREVMVNRQVWIPDAGPDRRGDYVVLTPAVLERYDDSTILSWLSDPEDADEEVFEDIIDAVQLAGVDILMQASQDKVYVGYIDMAVSAIDGLERRWGTHPDKKTKSGDAKDTFEVLVPWSAVRQWAEKYSSEHGYGYGGDLEGLAVNANEDTLDPDSSHFEADWSDVKAEWAKENLSRIFDLEAPPPIPGAPGYRDPKQLDLPLGEAKESEDLREADEVDAPGAMPDMLSGIPVELEHRVKNIIRDSSHKHGYEASSPHFSFGYVGDNYFPGGEYRLLVYFTVASPVAGRLIAEVFERTAATVLNVFKDYRVFDRQIARPEEWSLPENTVVLSFQLYKP